MPNNAKFHLLRQIDLTCESHYDPIRKSFTPRNITAPASFAVTWPDGTPCSLVEMYLISKFRRGASVREDGGSLRTAVSKLMHLVRYCWPVSDFWELDDEDISKLIDKLVAETKPEAPLVRVRDNNTVRAIVAEIIDFLVWLQNEVMVNQMLVGVGPEYRVRLKERKVFDSRRSHHVIHLVYHRLPPPDTKEPKRPMGRDKRNALWEAVAKLSRKDIVPPPWARSNDYGALLTSYLKARRELLLELLEATGARPGELSNLRVLVNDECYKSQELVLVTLKRRRFLERTIKLQPSVAMRLSVFIQKQRANLLRAIQSENFSSDAQDRVFLGINGAPLSARSLGSEFTRLSLTAGLSGYQSCMSMFRHRFITKQVAIHLGIYLGLETKTRELMTDRDYRTILKKVATVTGHGSEASLLHYVDLAWEELDTGNQVDAAISIDASIERASTQVTSLIDAMENSSGRSAIELLKVAQGTILEMQREIRTALSKREGLSPHNDCLQSPTSCSARNT